MKLLCSQGLLILSLLSPFTFAAAVTNTSINAKVDDAKTLAEGESLYQSICAGCHKKDLTGETGFNLIDGEWIHGGQAIDIYQNITNGFAEQGMPAFGAVLSAEQRESIVAYILSKQIGWRELSYKMYELDAKKTSRISAELDAMRPIKHDTVSNNLPNFSMAEVQAYAYIFEGDVLAPRDVDTQLMAFPAGRIILDVWIDGEFIDHPIAWKRSWPLKRGKQHVVIKMMTPPPGGKAVSGEVPLYIMNSDLTRKIAALSVSADQDMRAEEFNVIAQSKPLILRKTVLNLPANSISVGLPQKLNYAFNTKSCSVVGLWKGDLLNIGPNIVGRGNYSSLPLGDWLMRDPATIALNTAQDAKPCAFLKYDNVAEPRFFYRLGELEISLSIAAPSSNALQFNYTLKGTRTEPFVVTIPESLHSNLNSDQLTEQNATTYTVKPSVEQFSFVLNF